MTNQQTWGLIGSLLGFLAPTLKLSPAESLLVSVGQSYANGIASGAHPNLAQEAEAAFALELQNILNPSPAS